MKDIELVILKSMELTVILYMACFFMYILKKNNVIKNLKVLPIIIFLVIIFSWLILKGGYECISILYMVLLSWFFMYILKKNNVITKLKITTLFMPIIIVLAGIILSGIATIGIACMLFMGPILSGRASMGIVYKCLNSLRYRFGNVCGHPGCPICFFVAIWIILTPMVCMALLSWFFMYILKKNDVIKKLKITTLLIPIILPIIVSAGVLLYKALEVYGIDKIKEYLWE